MLNYHGRDSGRPHQPFEVLDAVLSDMQRRHSWESKLHEIQEDNSDDHEKLWNLDYAYGLLQSMRSKMAEVDQARMIGHLTITRLRQGVEVMEAEQRELNALKAELKVNLQRAEKYIETQKKAEQELGIDEFLKENNLTTADIRKMRGPRAQPCLPTQTTSSTVSWGLRRYDSGAFMLSNA